MRLPGVGGVVPCVGVEGGVSRIGVAVGVAFVGSGTRVAVCEIGGVSVGDGVGRVGVLVWGARVGLGVAVGLPGVLTEVAVGVEPAVGMPPVGVAVAGGGSPMRKTAMTGSTTTTPWLARLISPPHPPINRPNRPTTSARISASSAIAPASINTRPSQMVVVTARPWAA
jgi:hypothetical protein